MTLVHSLREISSLQNVKINLYFGDLNKVIVNPNVTGKEILKPQKCKKESLSLKRMAARASGDLPHRPRWW